ncbi:MepB family protein [Epilithonimonas sp.]|uniref:MepB family protein n=1 Tax=Epilithonimonas sp. TaxID=2894511 RepID=UPI00289CCE71|nr:MepB family protein [Epilithonimonas sp.]
MNKEIEKVEKVLQKHFDLPFSEITQDSECEEYFGFNFKINQINFKFRKSKLTPKKMGQFVTLWKRNAEGKTIPFDINDNFDFYIIAVEENHHSGFFIFPKTVLEKENLISSKIKTGKRGFRIYTDWHFPNNKQAEKTKLWQSDFFINYTNYKYSLLDKIKKIIEFA